MDDQNENIRTPPAELQRTGMLRWFELSLALFAADRHTLENLDIVDRLAALADQEADLLRQLGLKEASDPPASKDFEPVLDFIELKDPKKFDARFWELAKKHKTYQAAYEAVEWEYQQTYGKTKYKNYNSYRNCRDKRAKSK